MKINWMTAKVMIAPLICVVFSLSVSTAVLAQSSNFVAAQPNPTSLTPSAIINTADMTDWTICNETSFILRMANATLRQGAVKAKGWRELQPGQCLDEKVVKNAPRLLYAESLGLHRGGIREWKGKIPLCVSADDFISNATDNCKEKNLQTRDYFPVKPDEQTTTLIESADFGDTAQVAGTQRLLRDAGYQITVIDGLPGRRTTQSLAEFTKNEGLDEVPEDKALISRLAEAAAKLTNKVGLEICNKTKTRLYSAVGQQDAGNWTSRGWWAIDPDQCVRPITVSLDGLDAHYYALKEAEKTSEDDTPEDLRLRSTATIPAQFCIAESQFSALGREYCLEGGYSVANFRPLPTDKDGVSVSLTDADFAPPAPQGLRR